MSFFDFFFPEQAQAVHLRTIAESSRNQQLDLRSQQLEEVREKRRKSLVSHRAEDRVQRLQDELAQSALVIESLISLLEEKKVLTRQEVGLRIAQIDSADGVVDGRITPEHERPDRPPLVPKRDWPG